MSVAATVKKRTGRKMNNPPIAGGFLFHLRGIGHRKIWNNECQQQKNREDEDFDSFGGFPTYEEKII